jgi:hydrogenase/urease accessory protein HupE
MSALIAFIRCSLAMAMLLAPQFALAHATQLSSSKLEVRGTVVEGLVEVNARDVDAALGTALSQSGGSIAAAALDRVTGALSTYVLARVAVRQASGDDCDGVVRSAVPKGDHVVLQVKWVCRRSATAVVYKVTLFHEIDPAARHMVTVAGDVGLVGLLSVGLAELPINLTATPLSSLLWQYFAAGVEHIAIGYDHIAFLVAVILWRRRFLALVKMVTAFTVAHSITLSLAALDVFRLPSPVVETLIAVSIIYVAIENFFVSTLQRRWSVTFVFGLVHGFGFASVLQEYGLPRDALVPALAMFNLGVEAGQISIVLMSLGVFWIVDRWLRSPGSKLGPDVRFVRAVSALILSLGIYWFAERLVR